MHSDENFQVEIVDLPLSDDNLAYSIEELLDLLIDKDSFETFNLGKQTVDDVSKHAEYIILSVVILFTVHLPTRVLSFFLCFHMKQKLCF